MDDWLHDWMKAVETVSSSIGQFLDDVGKEINDAVDVFIELTDEMTDEMERAITPSLDQLDRQIDEWIEPILLAFDSMGSTIDRAVEPVSHTVEPLLNQHPICVGCRHYHGQTYNGNMLVCAMHPYGIVDGSETCPDKEPITWSLPSANRTDSSDDPF